MWMLWHTSWIFCSRHFELKCCDSDPIKSQEHHIKIIFTYQTLVYSSQSDLKSLKPCCRRDLRTKLKLSTSQATWVWRWLGLKSIKCLNWLFLKWSEVQSIVSMREVSLSLNLTCSSWWARVLTASLLKWEGCLTLGLTATGQNSAAYSLPLISYLFERMNQQIKKKLGLCWWAFWSFNSYLPIHSDVPSWAAVGVKRPSHPAVFQV